MNDVNLLPRPRSMEQLSGRHSIEGGRLIHLDGVDEVAPLLHIARRLQAALREHAAVDWPIATTGPAEAREVGIVLRLASGREGHEQGYMLTIEPEQIVVEARTRAGLFYAVCTLAQILAQVGGHVPCMKLEDWPDFAVRGVMLDVSRDRVPTMDTLRDLVDMLAGWKINQLQLYTEHTFAYRRHPEVWASASPLTGEEIVELDLFCREREIELVPNQNSFGHMHRWMAHPRYSGLAETHDEFDTPWFTRMQGPFSLCPLDPGSIELVRSLYDELLPFFSSRLFNVGCDETFDLGQGRSREACEQRGAGRVYLDFLLQIYQDVKARGRRMQFWGDIIVQHPELVPELPDDVVALEWGYEADHPFAAHCPLFQASGLEFYVCPGTSSWCSIAGRTHNALANLASAAVEGRKHGAHGYLITDWGDRGHWQVLPISYLGFAAGAAFAWDYETNQALDIAQSISLHAFRDPTGMMGRVAYDLGNVYRISGLSVPNGSTLFWVLQSSLTMEMLFGRGVQPTSASFVTALEAIDDAMDRMHQARMNRPDAVLIREEFEQTAALLRHACRRGQLALAEDPAEAEGLRAELDRDLRRLIPEYIRLWLARNRPGGLDDSVARLADASKDYNLDASMA